MEINTYTEQKLSEYSKTDLIRLVLNQQKDTEALSRKLDLLIEQVHLANQQRFGQKTERTEIFDQMSFCINEAEDILQGGSAEEPEIGHVVKEHVRKPRPKGKREEDLKGLPVTVIEHTLAEERLQELFGGKYHRLPDEVYKKLAYHPATFEVEEHHIAVYAGGKDQTVVKADRPCELLKNSIATPSLVAGILNAKYVNAIPIHRMEQEFKRNDINLSRQVMSHWAILSAERYLSLIYDRMHKALYDASVINADETPFKVMKD
ncbi:MAG: transposase, partial [Clostridiales bacterium]|nr:transposase [Clostridiales bacterium]